MTAAVLNHLWQSTLFASGLGLLTLLFRHNGAHIRYWLWFAASAKFLIPYSLLIAAARWLLPADMTVTTTPTVIVTAGGVTAPFPSMSSQPSTAWVYFLVALLAIWAVGCVSLLLLWFARQEKLRETVSAAKPMVLPAPIPVLESCSRLEPGLVGICKPVLLLPEGITARLTPEEMYGVLAHEICHFERRDNLTAAIHMLVEAVFWFHPLVWWMGGRLLDERERACDERVLEYGNDPLTYAQGILKVCQHYLRSSLACAAGISGADLKRRVEAVMANSAIELLGTGKKLILTGLAFSALVLPVSGGLLAAPASSNFAGPLSREYTEMAYKQYVEALQNSVGSHDELGLAVLLLTEKPMVQLAKRFGAFKSITFKGTSPDGGEVYDVAFEGARAEWRIVPTTKVK
jgi:beta-lactamase regulating signal transducer with metallopeptidase domain